LAIGTNSANGEDQRWPRWLSGALVVLLLLGCGWRAGRYFMQFPIWGDEAHIALNVMDRDFAQLTQPLRMLQAAPLLFLWAERAVYETCGASELALRAVALVAGVLALLLFVRLARALLPPAAAVLAVGILAVSYYPVRHSCEVKAYALDLFVAVGLLNLAVSWLQDRERLLPLLALALLTPLGLGLSYPAVFVAGAISLVLLPAVWTQPGWHAKAAFVFYNATMISAFLLYFTVASAGQFESTRGNWTAMYASCFPPAHPVELVRWLVSTHTGTMLAYPVGAHSGGSTLTTLLCGLGIACLVRQRRLAVLGLYLLPFGLTLVAAILHRYPYGGSARYEQHLAPAICLLAALGLASALHWLARTPWRARCLTGTALAVLALIGMVGLARDVWKPHKTAGDREARAFFEQLGTEAGLDDQIVVMTVRDSVGPNLEWYLRQLGPRVRWDGAVDWERVGSGQSQLWALYFRWAEPTPAELDAMQSQAGQPLTLVRHEDRQMQMGWHWSQNTRERCQLYLWRCAPPPALVRGEPR